MILAYDEIVDFISAGSTPQGVVDFVPSEATRQRVWELLQLQKAGSFTPENESELQHYLEMEHIMRLAKARARARLARE